MIGQKLGSFRIEEVLGSGAMGIVYRAVNETNGRVAAVKVVTGEMSQKGTGFERFRRESEILQQFRHPNIVRFLAVGRFQGTSYFAMEFVPGTTLEDILKHRGAMPWPEVVDLGIQLCNALEYAHEHGVVHRDLKPSNLMISEAGQLKLTDFGIAKDLDATALTAPGRTVGTAAYMAPEQIRGAPAVSHKTDLYALGVVLYQMLTGDVPFSGQTAVVMMHRHLTDTVPRPSTKVLDIPLELDNLIVRMMAKDPPDRPWDAIAVGHILSELKAKRQAGQPIPMVWPAAGAATIDAPTAPGRIQPTGEGKAKAKAKNSKKKGAKGDRTREAGESILEDPRFQTAMLALTLVGLVLLLGYLLWPPSAAYLHRHAEALMASEDSTAWINARRDYIDPLDRRFPDHPYRDDTRDWRDRILLHAAGSRAKRLENPNLGSVLAASDVEEVYRRVHSEVTEDLRVHRDVEAVARWRALAGLYLDDEVPETDRMWGLLARQKADELEARIVERRDRAIGLLERADTLAKSGRGAEAERALIELIDRYREHPELADLIAAARSRLGVPPAPRPRPPAIDNSSESPM